LACGLFQQLNLPITLTAYPSGFMVLSNTSEAAAIVKVVQSVEVNAVKGMKAKGIERRSFFFTSEAGNLIKR